MIWAALLRPGSVGFAHGRGWSPGVGWGACLRWVRLRGGLSSTLLRLLPSGGEFLYDYWLPADRFLGICSADTVDKKVS